MGGGEGGGGGGGGGGGEWPKERGCYEIVLCGGRTNDTLRTLKNSRDIIRVFSL